MNRSILRASRLVEAYEALKVWLLRDVYPLWTAHGVDASSGGFVESIGPEGALSSQPRRLRVQARQVFAFAHAGVFGAPVQTHLIRRGLRYMVDRYQRADGLFRTLVAADGEVLDERALLYDQSFVLLAYAAAAAALDERTKFEGHARELRQRIASSMGASDGAFYSDTEHPPRRESNPHMHLLEACLAWAGIGMDSEWRIWVRDISALAPMRFLRAGSGLLGESFTAQWVPSAGIEGRIIEPGHQFEWAWLMLRARPWNGGEMQQALQLIDVTERVGVRHGVAVNALLDDLSLHDGGARLWPQTERLKAALLAAQVTGEARYTQAAVAAAESFFPYLNRDTPGLWFDVRTPDGTVVQSSAPASTLYHLVGAIVQLHRAIHAA